MPVVSRNLGNDISILSKIGKVNHMSVAITEKIHKKLEEIGFGENERWNCRNWNDAQVKETVSETLPDHRTAAPQRCRSKVPIAFDGLYDIEITWK